MKKIRQSSNIAGGSRHGWPLGSLTLAHVRAVLVGPCGGTMSYDRTLVESGVFNGAATLLNFCGDGRVLAGQFGVTATFDTNTWTPIAATATFTNLQAVTDGGTEAHMVNGTVGIILAASGFDTTINVVMTDNNSVRIFELKNFAVNTSEGGSSDTLTLSGIFIDSGSGYQAVGTCDYDLNCSF
ncbi:MAG: hypothetical protein ACNA74_05410 [Desulfurivibrio sp.]